MKGVAIERWSCDYRAKIFAWLNETFGSSNKESWYEDQDYDLFTLVMTEEIYMLYVLRWGNDKRTN